MSKPVKFILLFLILLVFRTVFCLYTPPVQPGIDELQTYLIGLKCYTTHTWPYFGPDVNGAEVPGFNSQIPGALEGLLIGLPFYILPLPETPFIVVTLLSTLGAALLAWYIQARIPQFSLGWLFVWICITPWSLFEGAHLINPAFLFLPSVLFFIGFMESLPAFSMKLLSPFWNNALMGFSLLWVMQFHFSYVYFLPLAAFSLGIQIKESRNGKSLLYFAIGTAPMAALIIPTFLKYGLMRTNVASGFAVPFNWHNVLQGPVILGQFIALVCFELLRFLGSSMPDRVGYLVSHPFLTVPGFLLWGIGILQVAVLLLYWFNPKHFLPGWRELKWLLLAFFLLVWLSFWFTNKRPASHIYMCFFPWLMLYSCYVWGLFAENLKWKNSIKLFLVVGLYFQWGYALTYPRQYSIYTQRDLMAAAIHHKDYRLLGERRTPSFY